MYNTCEISVCDDEWTPFLIGNEINCLKKVGRFQLKEANTQCQSLNASQILPRNSQESDNLVSALLSLDLDSENGNLLVSIGIYQTKEEEWRDFTDQLISFFDWLPNEPDNYGENENYAGLSINEISWTTHWKSYNGTNELNVVCTKRSGQGKHGPNCTGSWNCTAVVEVNTVSDLLV